MLVSFLFFFSFSFHFLIRTYISITKYQNAIVIGPDCVEDLEEDPGDLVIELNYLCQSRNREIN